MKAFVFCVIAGANLLLSAPLQARDLIYQPVSPSFGGSPLNGPYVLGLAAANNSRYLENPQARAERRRQGDPNSTAAQFERQITSSVLARVGSQISDRILGENAENSGRFVVGSTVVEFNRVGGMINVDITEGSTGGRTNIQIPVPQF